MKKETVTLITTTAISGVAILAGVGLLVWGPAEQHDLGAALIAGGVLAGGLPSVRSAWKSWRAS
jgi:hypothetical protein